MATILILCASLGAQAQDYARESRWKAEVLGNLVVGEAVDIRVSSGRSFLGLHAEGKRGQPAVLLVHGLGVHPDHGVIGSLRVTLNDMGFTTLSIQMPVLAADAAGEAYEPLVPDAMSRIAAGRDWLLARAHSKIVLASHSLGSRFALESARSVPFTAWICMGRAGEVPKLPLPVLDVYGEKDNPAVLKSASSRRASRQVMVRGADHFYNGKEDELARVLREFIAGL